MAREIDNNNIELENYGTWVKKDLSDTSIKSESVAIEEESLDDLNFDNLDISDGNEDDFSLNENPIEDLDNEVFSGDFNDELIDSDEEYELPDLDDFGDDLISPEEEDELISMSEDNWSPEDHDDLDDAPWDEQMDLDENDLQAADDFMPSNNIDISDLNDSPESEVSVNSAAALSLVEKQTELLTKIEKDLSSIKEEIFDIRKQLDLGTKSVQAATDEEDNQNSGFFDEDDDESIVLTGDELDNIFNTAEMTVEEIKNNDLEQEDPGLSMLSEADEAPQEDAAELSIDDFSLDTDESSLDDDLSLDTDELSLDDDLSLDTEELSLDDDLSLDTEELSLEDDFVEEINLDTDDLNLDDNLNLDELSDVSEEEIALESDDFNIEDDLSLDDFSLDEEISLDEDELVLDLTSEDSEEAEPELDETDIDSLLTDDDGIEEVSLDEFGFDMDELEGSGNKAPEVDLELDEIEEVSMDDLDSFSSTEIETSEDEEEDFDFDLTLSDEQEDDFDEGEVVDLSDNIDLSKDLDLGEIDPESEELNESLEDISLELDDLDIPEASIEDISDLSELDDLDDINIDDITISDDFDDLEESAEDIIEEPATISLMDVDNDGFDDFSLDTSDLPEIDNFDDLEIDNGIPNITESDDEITLDISENPKAAIDDFDLDELSEDESIELNDEMQHELDSIDSILDEAESSMVEVDHEDLPGTEEIDLSSLEALAIPEEEAVPQELNEETETIEIDLDDVPGDLTDGLSEDLEPSESEDEEEVISIDLPHDLSEDLVPELIEEVELEEVPEESVFDNELIEPEAAELEKTPVPEVHEAIEPAHGPAVQEMPETSQRSYLDDANSSASLKKLPPELREEIREILTYMDQLLESLPEEKIQEFARSEHFEVYKKIFEELGITS